MGRKIRSCIRGIWDSSITYKKVLYKIYVDLFFVSCLNKWCLGSFKKQVVYQLYDINWKFCKHIYNIYLYISVNFCNLKCFEIIVTYTYSYIVSLTFPPSQNLWKLLRSYGQFVFISEGVCIFVIVSVMGVCTCVCECLWNFL